MFSVETRTVAGSVTSVGSAGPYTVVIDRPLEAGGGGLGFNGGQLLYLAIAGCISNDLYREAALLGLQLDAVRVSVDGDFAGSPAVSTPVTYTVEIRGAADAEALTSLVHHVDRIAEIPNSLRLGTTVELAGVTVSS